ncbi:MAG TPA: six-hairpin glycosidase, partial [Clostridiales bacterium]|nr:six-hairpin glycosidase [Clostridiales bacterium]
MNNHENQKYLSAVPHQAVSIDDGFWSPKLKTLREITVDDVFTKLENSGAMSNFDRVRDEKTGGHAGAPWFDGLIYETICAASDFLESRDADGQRLEKLDKYIGQIIDAQENDPDGFISTFTQLTCPENRWGENGGNALWQHDLFNAGCLVEAAVHYYLATGKADLLKAAVKFAGYLCEVMGYPPKKNIIPGHSLPEKALVELYRVLTDEPDLKMKYFPDVDANKFLELADFWISNRGQHKDRMNYPRYMGEYAQDHRPMLEQEEAVGHVVRATFLYNGLIAVAMATGKQQYFDISAKLWDNVTEKKLHLNGGVGAIHYEEKFGYEYQLPNNAYLETCAAIGLSFWGRNMNLAFADARYMDVVEMALYNGILSGVSLDGNKYFYLNPLISDGSHHRWDWHWCPCCPPMLLKIMSDLKSFIYS